MQVLFVSSGNQKNTISPIILNQGNSLSNVGISVKYYQIVGKGILGYLKSVPRLRRHLKKNSYDIIHAHYALTGIVASFACARPIVVSLMGSDVYQFRWLRLLIVLFSKHFWSATIVKSKRMKEIMPNLKAVVLPNGVDLKKFKIIPSDEVKAKFPNKKHPWVIFIGHPTRKEKNRALADETMTLVLEPAHEYLPLFGIDHDLLPYYMNAASVLLMTSLWEGSPNVIKEAMACNLPIVTVDVGDVYEVIGNTKSCYITSYQDCEIAEKIKIVLTENKRTNGRLSIQHLSNEKIATRLKELYLSILN